MIPLEDMSRTVVDPVDETAISAPEPEKPASGTISTGTSAEPFSANRKFMVDEPLYVRPQPGP